MSHNDNPAERLHFILMKGLKIDENKRMNEAFADLFNVDVNKKSEILRNLGLLNRLPHEIRLQVKEKAGDEANDYLSKLGNVESALSKINFGSKWRTFKQPIDEATLIELKFTSKLLSQNSEYKYLESNELDEIKQKVHSFKKYLEDLNTDRALKTFIFGKISEIDQAIIDYELTGSIKIQKEIDRAFGSIIIQPKVMLENEGVVRKLFQFLSDVSVTIHIAEYAPKLGEFGMMLLEKGMG